jgi:tetrapyrrole methylase family protein/MazG family protein
LENDTVNPEKPSASLSSIDTLIRLIGTLRGENGCPWDRRQTPRSISVYLTEELYELIDAIEADDSERVCEELGDVLFHIFFIARIYEENGRFDIGRVADLNTAKMTRRHPHVFGDDRVENTRQIRKRWHEIKKEEKKHDPDDSTLDSVPLQLPALMRAYRLSERAAGVGFDWTDISGVMEKVEEEWEELQRAIAENDRPQVSVEFGDLLFTLVNLARFVRIHPETALTTSIRKFEARFRRMEKIAAQQGREVSGMSQVELDALWDRMKRNEK